MAEKDLKFPEKGSTSLKVKLELKRILKEVKNWKMEEKIGGLHSQPHPISVHVWNKLLKFNPNNLGNWSLASQKNLDGTQLIEMKLIKMLIDLYGGNQNQWEGYVTSGGTEANIFSAWAGRNSLEKRYKRKQLCLIKSSLSHYSIAKAADIVGVESAVSNLNRETWSTDLSALEKTIKELERKGYRGFLIPVTLGYTQTGTNDDYQEIVKYLKKLEKSLKITTFTWIDAALNGLVLPFTRNDFLPLANSNINAICIDFHKTGMLPIPCGIVLYQKSLRSDIEKSIPYIFENDNTLLGSRTGIPSVAAYSVITLLGRKGFKKVIRECQHEKREFIQKTEKRFPEMEIIDDKDSISIGLVTKKALPQSFLLKYGIFAKKHTYTFSTGKENLYIYKAAFLYRQ